MGRGNQIGKKKTSSVVLSGIQNWSRQKLARKRHVEGIGCGGKKGKGGGEKRDNQKEGEEKRTSDGRTRVRSERLLRRAPIRGRWRVGGKDHGTQLGKKSAE